MIVYSFVLDYLLCIRVGSSLVLMDPYGLPIHSIVDCKERQGSTETFIVSRSAQRHWLYQVLA